TRPRRSGASGTTATGTDAGRAAGGEESTAGAGNETAPAVEAQSTE
ncbi:MAG: 30S ribosomal protein S3, partial [Mycobacterium pseudokansasii]|nr:30S ribosomal protein S3 [Mycobacterium pseudokansasii]